MQFIQNYRLNEIGGVLTGKGRFLMNLQRRKSLTKYFTGAHHRHKSVQLILMYEASKLYGLLLCESAENDIVSLTGVSTSCLHIGGTFLQRVSNIIAYHILVIADKHYGFSEHDIFDDCINHK